MFRLDYTILVHIKRGLGWGKVMKIAIKMFNFLVSQIHISCAEI